MSFAKLYSQFFAVPTHNQIYDQALGEGRICELTGAPYGDVHHIECKGIGGRKSMDFIENLMALCRDAHTFYGDKKQYKEWLKEWHLEYLDHQTPMYIIRPDDPIFKEYLNYKYGNVRL